jgi:hypothetical protein
MSKHSRAEGPRLLCWDIERVPHLGYHWGLFDQNIGLSQLVLPGETVCFAARWYGEPKSKVIFRSTFHHGKQAMIDEAFRLLDAADGLVSWNGASFDTRHMKTEIVLTRTDRPSPAKEVDLLRTARHHFKFASNKLEFVAEALGVGKKMVHEGFPLWLKVMAGDPKGWEKFRKYNIQDTNLLVDLLDRMYPWVDSLPNANLYGADGCPRCGAAGSLQSRGTRKTTVGVYPRFVCTQCNGWSTGTRRTEGITVRAES